MWHFLRYALFALIFTGINLIGLASAQPAIFNATASAIPGDAISLQGDFGAAAIPFLTSGVGTATQTIALPVLVQSSGQLSAQLPDLLAAGLYQVWVEEGQQRSATVFVNQARGMHFDSPEAAPGKVLRLFGRNLLLAGMSPEVRFVAQNGGGGGGPALVDISQSDAYALHLTAPATLQPGVAYDVFVTNGSGGSNGETKVEQTLQAIPAGVDYFQLGVPWAGKFTFYTNVYNVKTDARLATKALGNGIADDMAAIQAAIMQANSNGGGIVYLPAGTYKLVVAQGEGLTIYSNVVLQGAGPQQTIIRYGYGPTGFKFGLVFYGNGQKMGVADLSLENVNEQGQWVHNVYTGYPGQVSDVFMSNVNATYSGDAITFSGHPSRLLIKDCRLISKYNPNVTNSQGPLTILMADNVLLKHNYIQHEVNQTIINDDVHNVVLEQNTFVRDCGLQYLPTPIMVETRTLSMNFAKNVAMLANSFESINGRPKNNNDGETILNEGGAQQRRDAYYGNISGASATTLQDNTANWAKLTSSASVVIIDGKGRGQIRKITNNTAQALTLTTPWTVVPDATSRYSITTFSAENWLIKDNTLLNNNQGILLFGASSQQIAVVGNHLTSNGGIWLRPGQEIWNGAQVFNVIFNTQVIGNTVENLGSVVPAFIGLVPYQYAAPVTMGTGAIGIEIRNNSVRALPSYTPTSLYGVDREGYYSYFRAQFSGDNGNIPVTLGTIFQNNTAINCPVAFYLNSGAYNTLVCHNTLTNVGQLLQDDQLPTSTHASVNTVTCAANASPGTGNQRPVADPKINLSRPNQARITELMAFTGSDPDGTITKFKVSELPDGARGALYFRGLPLALTTTLKTSQVDSVTFRAIGVASGDVRFKYIAIDNQSLASEAVAFVITGAAPLPVDITSFTAKANSSDALLKWTTATEKRDEYFVVERSFNGQDFAEAGRVAGLGVAGIGAAYTFTDTGIGTRNQQLIYYRLKQSEQGHSNQYSVVRNADFTNALSAVVELYPNPAVDVLRVLLPTTGAHLLVCSLTGQLLFKTYTGSNNALINVANLPDATYLLIIHADHGPKSSSRFSKQSI